MTILPAKPTLVIATLLLMCSAPDFIPAFKDYKVLDWHSTLAVFDFHARQRHEAPLEEEQLRLKPDTEEQRHWIREHALHDQLQRA